MTKGKTASLTLRDNDRSAYASLPPKGGHAHISAKALSGQRSPTRLVNTSRLWLTGHAGGLENERLRAGGADDAAAYGRSHTYMRGRAILQGAPCAPVARPRRSCNGATAPPQGVTIPNADATS